MTNATDLFSAIGLDLEKFSITDERVKKSTKPKRVNRDKKNKLEKKESNLNKRTLDNRLENKEEKREEKKGFSTISSLLQKYQVKEPNKHLNTEFQSFGFRMAVELSDLKHKSLYIKMAKEYNRGLLERSLSFVKDANISENDKAKLFMWKLKKLRDEAKEKDKK